ncbi:MAG: creatininase family protein [Candidatus Latescibacterota bacterium]
MKYEELLPQQIEGILEQTPVVFVPWGALEWHGPHLAIGNDGIKAAAICDRVAAKTGGAVLPPVYFGHHTMMRTGFRHSLENKEATIRAMAYDLLGGLESQGFTVAVILAGHYSSRHVATLKEVAEKFSAGKAMRVWALAEYEVVTDMGYTGDHAAKWETSILMYLRPDLVDMTRLRADPKEELEGVFGDDPTEHASPEVGREIVDAIVARMSERVTALLHEEGEEEAREA